jgi:hypothetical protein
MAAPAMMGTISPPDGKMATARGKISCNLNALNGGGIFQTHHLAWFIEMSGDTRIVRILSINTVDMAML